MNKAILLLCAASLLAACQPKQDDTGENAQQTSSTEQTAGQRDVSTETLLQIDSDIQSYADAVDAAKAAFDADANAANKEQLVKAYVAFGDYMQYESSVSPRQGKYHRALIEYRHALELDPGSTKITAEIAQIEDIYKSMGRPVPGDE
jgi:tetratricopeptide (TPR) repeat protein